MENLKDGDGKRVIKTCTYKWKTFSDTGGMADGYTVRTEKQIGQPLVFRREEFLTAYEVKALYSRKSESGKNEKVPF